MDRYVPTYEESCHLRATFMELIDDYLVLYLMRGQRDFSDTFLSPSEKAQREEAAWQTSDYLMDVVKRIDTLAGTPSLGEAWSELSAISERYAGVHESFKPLRVVAKAWDVDPGGTVAHRGGRPRKFQAREDVLEWLRPQVEAIKSDGSYPSIEMVAAYKDCHENTIRLHIRPYWPDWDAVLADL